VDARLTRPTPLPKAGCINRPPQKAPWLQHFALGYLLADPGLYCTLIVTNQTAYAIFKYAPEHSSWLERLLSGEAWGATWMSETQGGSDLGANNTLALREGEVEADQERWFFAQQRWVWRTWQ
jgi:alkylation response protein AidB-like acyl-CoA dehydrogenase